MQRSSVADDLETSPSQMMQLLEPFWSWRIFCSERKLNQYSVIWNKCKYLHDIIATTNCFFRAPVLPLFKISLQRHFSIRLTLHIFRKKNKTPEQLLNLQNFQEAKRATQVQQLKCSNSNVSALSKHDQHSMYR